MFNDMYQVCRAKKVEDDNWIEGYYVFDKEHLIVQDLRTIVRGTAEHVNVHAIESETIGRAVGRTDKNGVQMFEGDIVKGYGVISYIVKYGEFNGNVGLGYYYGIGFHLERVGHPDHKVPLSSISLDKGEFEIVGNIYDNHELLAVEG